MMLGEQEDVFLVSEAERRPRINALGAELEATVRFLVHKRARRPRGWFDHAKRARCGRPVSGGNNSTWGWPSGGNENAPQRSCGANSRSRLRRQATTSESAAETQGRGNVIGIADPIELRQKPQTLLRKGQYERPSRATRSGMKEVVTMFGVTPRSLASKRSFLTFCINSPRPVLSKSTIFRSRRHEVFKFFLRRFLV